MKIKLMVAVCGLAFVVSGCGKSDSAATPTSVSSISGVVATGVPVVGVTVTVTDVNGKTASSGPTDATGNYSINSLGLQAPLVLTASFIENDGTTGVLSAVSNKTGAVLANLTPVTSLITQRVFATALNAAPTAAQINTKATAAGIQQATADVTTALAPLFSSLNVPSSASSDPVGSSLKADPSLDAMDALVEVARIHVRNGTVGVGFDADKVVLNIPAAGAVDAPAKLTSTALNSVKSLATGSTSTPIKNVIVVITENQTFDNIFAAYQPKSGNTIRNLLAQGIIKADGTAGANFSSAAQKQATGGSVYTLNPARTTAYTYLPQPLQTGMFGLTASGFGTVGTNPDPRYTTTMPNGPFQISKYVPYAITPAANSLPAIVAATTATFTADPVHRFFQMWQQTGGTNASLDLYTWVATTTGQGIDSVKDGGGVGTINPPVSASTPNQGGEVMGFYNMNAGDAPVFKSLADSYAMSDNYHQSIMGGTGMNFFSIATADLPVYNTNGSLTTPPANQIENPDPAPGTNNFYTRDGYQGGSYVNCSDSRQPGVSAILAVLATAKISSNCASGAYYLVNNYAPPYAADGTAIALGATNYVYPPQTVPTIGEALSAKNITWKWYLGGRDAADVTGDQTIYPLVKSLVASNPALAGAPAATIDAVTFSQTQPFLVNPIGDPHLASKAVMTGPLKSNLVGLTTFYNDVKNGTLPAVSFVVPKNLDSGHPGNSSPILAEMFLSDLIAKVKASGQWKTTAIIVTTDEGGGYFDSGAIQMLDFFGDGTRVPLLVISPYARTGYVDHVYHDHGSILKFIERNWRLKPLSARSRDNLPNPVASANDPYMPVNGPSIGDLMTMFAF